MSTKKAASAPRKPTKRPAKPAKSSDPEADILARIAKMPEPFRPAAKRLHALIRRAAPHLQPRVWYGMPGYAKKKDAPVLCFFRADKEYMTFGITQFAGLAPDPGAPHQLIPSAWYFTTLDEPTEAALAAIVRRVTS